MDSSFLVRLKHFITFISQHFKCHFVLFQFVKQLCLLCKRSCHGWRLPKCDWVSWVYNGLFGHLCSNFWEYWLHSKQNYQLALLLVPLPLHLVVATGSVWLYGFSAVSRSCFTTPKPHQTRPSKHKLLHLHI